MNEDRIVEDSFGRRSDQREIGIDGRVATRDSRGFIAPPVDEGAPEVPRLRRADAADETNSEVVQWTGGIVGLHQLRQRSDDPEALRVSEHLRPPHLERIEAPAPMCMRSGGGSSNGVRSEARVPVRVALLEEGDTAGRPVVLRERPGVHRDAEPHVPAVEEPVVDPPVHDRVLDDVVERFDEHEAAEVSRFRRSSRQDARRVVETGSQDAPFPVERICRTAEEVLLFDEARIVEPLRGCGVARAHGPERPRHIGAGDLLEHYIASTTTSSGDRAQRANA